MESSCWHQAADRALAASADEVVEDTIRHWVSRGAPSNLFSSPWLISSQMPREISIEWTLLDMWSQVRQVFRAYEQLQPSLDRCAPAQKSPFVERVDNRHRACQRTVLHDPVILQLSLVPQVPTIRHGRHKQNLEMVRRLEEQLKSQIFDSFNAISILGFLQSKWACDTNGIHEGTKMWLFHFFMKAPQGHNARACLSSESHARREKMAVILQSRQLFFGEVRNRRHYRRGWQVHHEFQGPHRSKSSRIWASTLDQIPTLRTHLQGITSQRNIHWRDNIWDPTKRQKLFGLEQGGIATGDRSSRAVPRQPTALQWGVRISTGNTRMANAHNRNPHNIMNVESASSLESLVRFVRNGVLTLQ